MALEARVEAAIKEAIERGEFVDLAGEGRPPELSSDFETPAERGLVLVVQTIPGVAPREIELLREIRLLEAQAKSGPILRARRQLFRQLGGLQRALEKPIEGGHRRAIRGCRR